MDEELPMFVGTRKVVRLGRSHAVIVPSGTAHGEYATVVAGRLVYIDPEGEVTPETLLTLVKEFEPLIMDRLREIRTNVTRVDGRPAP